MAAVAQSRVWKHEDFAATAQTESAESDAKSDPSAEPGAEPVPVSEAPYWVFVCKPKKWAIDKFLQSRIERDSWGVRKSGQDRFAPGQLGILRVGVDQRNSAERDGKLRLEPGIYALCEVESAAYPGTGATDGFWAEGDGREPGWPTVRIRYLHIYASSPLTVLSNLLRERGNAPRRCLRAQRGGHRSGLVSGSTILVAIGFRTCVGCPALRCSAAETLTRELS